MVENESITSTMELESKTVSRARELGRQLAPSEALCEACLVTPKPGDCHWIHEAIEDWAERNETVTLPVEEIERAIIEGMREEVTVPPTACKQCRCVHKFCGHVVGPEKENPRSGVCPALSHMTPETEPMSVAEQAAFQEKVADFLSDSSDEE